ncbi:cyclase/dehydrase [Mycolicibacterium canariasense]|uniref:Cyclase/dehydrase n=1 Tax=Mycolicibacterium canariasense TaxID=228230 RepID=A0A100WEP2_MYCCR|nr:SRPBCC family protein [Mycolicibacterium canariasense]MCV7208917.1 SRPBCC family protein [Mycolicibacterium canariasense]ORV11391.1 polyketide cyclase [Mycolicibacterium canariasense]GAS96549.1 cyclase/dehydrase [Mycolicibacterium canariasense]
MGSPLLQAQIDIDAPVSEVWALISDLRRMPQWSPQCRAMKVLGRTRVGAKAINVNRRNNMFWPTTCTITELEPQRSLAFRVDFNAMRWSYELEPLDGGGTRVIESRRAPEGFKTVPTLLVDKFMGGVPGFEQELLAGMNASLQRIKTAAESATR